MNTSRSTGAQLTILINLDLTGAIYPCVITSPKRADELIAQGYVLQPRQRTTSTYPLVALYNPPR